MERRAWGARTDPLRELLLAGLDELASPAALVEPLAELATLLAQWAARMNLTGHRTPEAIARRLILDSIALAEALPMQPLESAADLGSGAGFPGLPLALRWPACRVTLIEPRARRHHFQRAAIRALGIANAHPVRGRAEALKPVAHELVVAQALAGATRALEWMIPWTAPGSWVALARSQGAPPFDVPAELEGARSIPYRVPLGGPERLLWIARRRPSAGRAVRPCDT